VEPDLPEFIGHVWMNGGPWLIADRLDAETWTGIEGDYQKKILPLTAWDTEISVGDGTGLVLSSDYDDSTIEVYRASPSELLIVGLRYANGVQPVEFLRDACTLDLAREGRMDVRSGTVAILESGPCLVRRHPRRGHGDPRRCRARQEDLGNAAHVRALRARGARGRSP
jgi:hypothetical protein